MAQDPYLENAVMDVLWDSSEWMTPRDVQEQLPPERTVEYTTVMTVLARLWKKGRKAYRFSNTQRNVLHFTS